MQNRFKSKVLWIGVGTQILSILLALGVIDMGCSEIINTILISVCELFVTFGILNNPTNPDKI